MISARRGSELALLTAEAALRARPAPGGAPPADLAEWLGAHAARCPDLAVGLPEVARLLRAYPGSTRPRLSAQAPVDIAASAGPGSGRVDEVMILTSGEAAERLRVSDSGVRWLAARGRFPGAGRNRVTGRWEIPAAAVAQYARTRSGGADASRT